MRRLLLLLFCTSVLAVSAQARRNKTTATVRPKTFFGKYRISQNATNSILDLTELIPTSNNTINYTSSILNTRIIPVSYIVAIAIGVPSNIFVLAFLRRKTRCLSSAILYLSLAVSDLMLLVSLTFKVHYHLHGNNWVFGELVCKLVTACFYGNLYCSIHAHMCVSVLRYLAVVHPFLYRNLSKMACTTWASLTVWMVFAVAMVPEFLTRQSYKLADVGVKTCHDVLPYSEDSYKMLIPYRLCLIALGFMLPSAVIAFAYGSIVRQLGRSSCDWTYYIRASTLIFGIFLLCFTPSSTIHFIHYVRLYTSQHDDFYIYFNAAVCLSCFHSCLDPFLSYIISKTTNSRTDFICISHTSSIV